MACRVLKEARVRMAKPMVCIAAGLALAAGHALARGAVKAPTSQATVLFRPAADEAKRPPSFR